MSNLTPRIDNIEGRLPNIIINPEVRISQRGDFTTASSAVNLTYYLDRWKTGLSGITANKQHITTNQPAELTGTKSLRYTATSTATGYVGVNQIVEDSFYYLNKTLTVSVYVKSNSTNARIGIYNGSSYEGMASHTGDGTWQRLTVTAILSAGASMLTVPIYLMSATGVATSLTSGDYIEFTGVKLELNSIMTPFVSRSVGEELMLCQRFYQICNFGGTGAAEGTTTIGIGGKFIVPMRAANPNLARTSGQVSIRHAGTDFYSTGSLANATANNLGWWTQVTGFTGLTSGAVAYDRATAGWLSAEAEL